MHLLFTYGERLAARVALDFEFNVFFYLLLLVIIVLLIVLCVKISGVNETLKGIQDILASDKESSTEPTQEKITAADAEFSIGQLVVRLTDEAQLRILSISPDGVITCTNGVLKEQHLPSEIADFNAYWKQKKH